jgi:enamine deaminase RidA (YjgF/YER057c/UK114 family)
MNVTPVRLPEAAGSSLEQSLKAQIYLARVDDFPDFVDV